jgi:hypothetical protein
VVEDRSAAILEGRPDAARLERARASRPVLVLHAGTRFQYGRRFPSEGLQIVDAEAGASNAVGRRRFHEPRRKRAEEHPVEHVSVRHDLVDRRRNGRRRDTGKD